jgi:hypothetical protein
MLENRGDMETYAEELTSEDVEVGDTRFQSLLKHAARTIIEDNDVFATDATLAFTLVSGQAGYDKPSNILANKFTDLYVDEVKLDPIEFKDRNNKTGYWFWGSKFYIGPTPVSGGSGVISFKSAPVEMTGASVSCGVSNIAARRAIVKYALSEYYDVDDDELASKYRQGAFSELDSAYETVNDLEPGEHREVGNPNVDTEEDYHV